MCYLFLRPQGWINTTTEYLIVRAEDSLWNLWMANKSLTLFFKVCLSQRLAMGDNIFGVYACVCKGVFVTATMAVSTVSVIESIIVMRLCSIRTTRMPSAVRFIAFRLIGRVLCVTRPPTSSTKHRHNRNEKTAERQANSDVQESLLGDTAMSNVVKSSSELIDKINDVLVELRKVRCSIFLSSIHSLL